MSIDRDSFKRLIGPIEDILMRNMKKYKKYMDQWMILLTEIYLFNPMQDMMIMISDEIKEQKIYYLSL